MYHLGKVLKVLKAGGKELSASDNSTQAIVHMWDQNQLILGVESSIASEVKEGSVVLADYSPLNHQAAVPKQLVVKVLRGELAKKSWELFEKYDSERRKKQMEPEEAPPRNLFT